MLLDRIGVAVPIACVDGVNVDHGFSPDFSLEKGELRSSGIPRTRD